MAGLAVLPKNDLGLFIFVGILTQKWEDWAYATILIKREGSLFGGGNITWSGEVKNVSPFLRDITKYTEDPAVW